MARTKKKTVGEDALDAYNDERLVSKHDKLQLSNQPSNGWPKISQGSHLTVKTFEDGRTELIWDDEALMRDVQEAIDSYEAQLSTVVSITEEKVKKTRKKAKA